MIFVLVSSVISANFSAFAQITPRPYYTVLETPIHNPDTLYEKTPAEFTTKITNQGTAAKPRDVFVKMSHGNDVGEHQTITLNSGPNGDDSKVMISGSGELSNVNTMISNTIPLSDVSEKTKQNIRAKLIGGDYGQYLLYNTSTDDDVVNEWKKLQEAAIKAKEKLKQAEQKRLDSTEKFYKSKDQKIKEKLDEVTKKSAQALEKAEKDRIAWLQAKSDVEKNDAKKIYDESRNNYEKIHEKEFSPINDAYYKSGDPDLKQKMYDALDEETKSRGDAYKAEHAANEAWDKLSNETKAKLSR